MRAPKGFGKRYFTLSAIQAYAGNMGLLRRGIRTRLYHLRGVNPYGEAASADEEELQTPENGPASLAAGTHRRPCHCNRHFRHRTGIALRAHPHPKASANPTRYTYTTLSPPPFSSTSPCNIFKGTS